MFLTSISMVIKPMTVLMMILKVSIEIAREGDFDRRGGDSDNDDSWKDDDNKADDNDSLNIVLIKGLFEPVQGTWQPLLRHVFCLLNGPFTALYLTHLLL